MFKYRVEIFFKQLTLFFGLRAPEPKDVRRVLIYFVKEMITVKKQTIKKMLSFTLFIVLIAATALFTVGCDKSDSDFGGLTNENLIVNGSVLGVGEKTFKFTVVDNDGNEVSCDIQTDKTIVGEALAELGLISGEESSWGLYVKVVNGITADYDSTGTYWAFYIDGEYALSGVDSTEIVDGSVYTFKVEK